MTRSELINILAKRLPYLHIKDAELSVSAILDAISNQLANGGRVEIRGFGSFQINIRPPRTARNPKTGEKVQVPAKAVPHFKTGKDLKEAVNIQK